MLREVSADPTAIFGRRGDPVAMINPTHLRKSALTLATVAAAGMGGAALADAASTSSSKSKARTTQRRGQARQALPAADAAKVKQAALDKVPGATVLRTVAGGPYSTPYHAHIRTSDGTLQVVLVDSSFTATTVQADNGPGGGHGGRHGGPGDHRAETPLTGDTKDKVEAAVKAKYPGATIVRTESDTDGSAPYEAHITTSAGKELEVQVGKDFAVVAASERPACP